MERHHGELIRERGIPTVAVIDWLLFADAPSEVTGFPLILVGDIGAVGLRDIEGGNSIRMTMGYKESREKLGEVALLMSQYAEKCSIIEILRERSRGSSGFGSICSNSINLAHKGNEVWELVEVALEDIAFKDRLTNDFRRAFRQMLGASYAAFFLKSEKGYHDERGSSFLPLDDPLIAYLQIQPIILDGVNWSGIVDPVVELSARNRMLLWSARLLIPVHENGTLEGLIACGVRSDGYPYDDEDKRQGVILARMWHRLTAYGDDMHRMRQEFAKQETIQKYLPKVLLLDRDEAPPTSAPLMVRKLVSSIRSERGARAQVIYPAVDQPLRIKGGMIGNTGQVWVAWEEASSEIFEREGYVKSDRAALLKEIALTLNHEIGNALVSLGVLQEPQVTFPPALLIAVKQDVGRLKILNDQIAQLSGVSEVLAEESDVRDLILAIGEKCDIRTEVGSDPVFLHIAPRLVEMALEAILDIVLQGRVGQELHETALQLRSTGVGASTTALISIRGKNLELEGILPPMTADSVPNQGRIALFVAKEILKLHHGSIHSGPGLEGTEILISIRRW